MSKWQNNVRCDECGAAHSFAHSASWANAFSEKYPCAECGNTGRFNWSNSVERWVSESTWWKPLTWGRGHWERKS